MGVERVDSTPDGALQRIAVQTRQGLSLQDKIGGLMGTASIQSIVTRDPTLEEAYLSILK